MASQTCWERMEYFNLKGATLPEATDQLTGNRHGLSFCFGIKKVMPTTFDCHTQNILELPTLILCVRSVQNFIYNKQPSA